MLTQRLRHRVTLQQQVQQQDSNTGAVEVAWADAYFNVAAEVLTGPGREGLQGAAKTAETTLRVTLRYLPGIDESMRLIWDGRAYDIASIEYDRTARREIRLACSGGLTDGR